jgi:hypothetical protein
MITGYVNDMPDATVNGIPFNFENVKVFENSFNVTAY